MLHEVEIELDLPHVRVELATITWQASGESPARESHALFQRLSHDHSPLRIGKLSAFDVLPRVRSIGFLPAGSSVPLFPIERPLRVLSCFYDAAFVEEQTGLAPSVWNSHTGTLVSLRNKRLEILMQELQAELEQPGLAHEFLVQGLTDVMVVELARVVSELERKRSRQGIALAPWQLRRIEERIKAAPEFGYPALGDLAGLCGISQGHLARSFKAATGWQIQKYIAEQRIAAAMRLLGAGELRCEEVSERLGFTSPGYFSTVIRRRTGRTPSEIRRQAIAARAGVASEPQTLRIS